MARRVLVVGGSRFTGVYLLDLLTDAGDEVTVYNRGSRKINNPNVRLVVGDRNNGFGLLAKQQFDVVFDMCAFKGEQTKKLIDEVKFDLVVHFGTVAVYSTPITFPIREDYPMGEWFWGEYGSGKIECEEVLAKSKVKHAVLRPTYILGQANYMDRENFLYNKLITGEVMYIPGNGQALTQFVFVDEVARSLFELGKTGKTGAYNCVGDECITLTGLVEQMAAVSGTKPNIKYDGLHDRGNSDEAAFPFANENFVFDNTKIKSELGIKFTPLVEGLKRDWENYYKNKQ